MGSLGDVGRTGLRRRNFWVQNVNIDGVISGGDIGSIPINGNPIINGSQSLTGALVVGSDATLNKDATVAGDITIGSSIYRSYVDGEGDVINNIPAEVVISGGMWVIGSAISGTTPSPVCKAGSFYQGTPLGICLTSTESGACPPILVKGVYKGLIADGNIAAGQVVQPGLGAAMNTVVGIGSDVNTYGVAYPKGIALMGGGSEAVTQIYLW
jgi:hypothetical protein